MKILINVTQETFSPQDESTPNNISKVQTRINNTPEPRLLSDRDIMNKLIERLDRICQKRPENEN